MDFDFVCHQHVTFASSGTFSPFLSPFLSVHLFCYHPPSPCYSLSNPLPPSLVPHPPSILALTHYELLAALMYGQYSLYHISTAEVCKGRDRKRRREGKEREREKMGRRHICSTHLSAKRYNYLSQHIIHVLYHPRAPCLCLAALTPCKAHILTLAMTVYLRKENCPQGDGEWERERLCVSKMRGKEGRAKKVEREDNERGREWEIDEVARENEKGRKRKLSSGKKKRQRGKKRERVTHQPFNKDHNSQTFSFRAKSKVDPFNKKHLREHTENLLCKNGEMLKWDKSNTFFPQNGLFNVVFSCFIKNLKKKLINSSLFIFSPVRD